MEDCKGATSVPWFVFADPGAVSSVSKYRITIQGRGTGFIGPLLLICSAFWPQESRVSRATGIRACSKVHRRIQSLGACRTLSLSCMRERFVGSPMVETTTDDCLVSKIR